MYKQFNSNIDEAGKKTCAKILVMKEPDFMMEYYPELYLQYIGSIKRNLK